MFTNFTKRNGIRTIQGKSSLSQSCSVLGLFTGPKGREIVAGGVSPRKVASKLQSPNGATDASVAICRPAGAPPWGNPYRALTGPAKIYRPLGPENHMCNLSAEQDCDSILISAS